MTLYRKRITKKIITLVSEGLQDKEIATRLNLSVKTVKWHLGLIYRDHGFSGYGSRLKLALQVAREKNK